MVKYIFTKFYSKWGYLKKIDIFIIVLVLSLISFGLSIYNSFQIKNLIKVSNIDKDGKVVLPLPDLIKKIDENSIKLGNKDAKITIVIFEDFQCPYCKKFNIETFPKLKEKYIDTGRVILIHQDYAFLGLESTMASEATYCAADQDKFWEYRDYLYNNQGVENSGQFSNNNLKSFAKTLGLDVLLFNSCLESRKHKDLVQKSVNFASSYGVSATPTFVINNQMIKGAVGIDSFDSIINNI